MSWRMNLNNCSVDSTDKSDGASGSAINFMTRTWTWSAFWFCSVCVHLSNLIMGFRLELDLTRIRIRTWIERKELSEFRTHSMVMLKSTECVWINLRPFNDCFIIFPGPHALTELQRGRVMFHVWHGLSFMDSRICFYSRFCYEIVLSLLLVCWIRIQGLTDQEKRNPVSDTPVLGKIDDEL